MKISTKIQDDDVSPYDLLIGNNLKKKKNMFIHFFLFLLSSLIIPWHFLFSVTNVERSFDHFLFDDYNGNFSLLRHRADNGHSTVCRHCDLFQEWPVFSHRLWEQSHHLADYCDEQLITVRRQLLSTDSLSEFVFQRAVDTLPFAPELIASIEALPEVVRYRQLVSSEKISLSPLQFFNFLHHPGVYQYYWSGDLESFTSLADLDFGKFSDEMWITDEFRNNPLWIGHAGVTTRRHFDYTHNVYLQLYGNKTFCLSQNHSIPTYPFFHPGFRQENLASEELIEQNDCITLKAGDALYIPPFTWHWVRAQSFSFSISFFSSQWQTLEDQLLSLPLPFEESWTSSQQSRALSLYLKYAFSDILPWLIQTRYLPTFGTADCSPVITQQLFPTVSFDKTQTDLYIDFNRTLSILNQTLFKFYIPNQSVHYQLVGTYIDKLLIYFISPSHLNYFLQCL